MEIQTDCNLIDLNTFGVSALAKFFVQISKVSELDELLKMPEFKDNERLFFGGGSNIVLVEDFDGIVVLNKIKGIETVEENEDFVFVKAMSGEGWNDLVSFAVERNLWGIENLALIPGTVGAAPMQNIGAYGAELKDTLVSLEVLEIETGEHKTFQNNECKFGYRDSIFKHEAKGKYFILSITIKLSKKENKNTEYRVLKQYLEDNKITPNTPKIISIAVSNIRRSKLPDPKVLGNAGSFFKNSFVTKEKLESLIQDYPGMPYFTEGAHTSPQPSPYKGEGENTHKIPTAWLIEQCLWKGKKVGNVGMHEKQALVLVNYGGATGQEIKNLAQQVTDSVYQKFGIILVPEVNLI